jgi:DNA mismatch endonuclease, patch repair protein
MAALPELPRSCEVLSGGAENAFSGLPLTPTSPEVSARFSRHPRRDTKPELALRRELHRRGLRYRVDFAPVSGIRRRADIVFLRAKIAVFVDGCFWHGCPTHLVWPKANPEWWRAKITRTVARDRDTDGCLVQHGWHVVRVWEHVDPHIAAALVADAVGARQTSASRC